LPGYKTHRKIALALCPFIAAGTWWVLGGHAQLDAQTWYEVKTALLVSGGVYIGNTWLTPDLDIPSSAYTAWGPLKLLWLPYQIMVKHRSPKSHWPILGVVLQHIYLWLIIAALIVGTIWAYNFLFLPNTDFGPRLYNWGMIPIKAWQVCGAMALIFTVPEYWIVLGGNIIGAMLHFIADQIESARKRHDRPLPPTMDEVEPEPIERRRHGRANY